MRGKFASQDLRTAGVLAAWLVVLVAFAYGVTVLNPAQSTIPVPMYRGAFVRLFFNYDGGWFIDIARHGYTGFSAARGWDNPYISTAFYPLYPAAVRLLSYPLLGHYFAAGLLVSWLSLFFALLYLRRLAALYQGEEAARRTCLCLLLFPTAVFLAAGYSESIFLLCAVAGLYHARRSSWVLAGLWGYLACLARPVGLAVGAAAALEALRQAGWRPRGLKPRMAALLAAPLGLATYMAYLWWRFDDPLVFVKAESAGWGWRRELSFKGLLVTARGLSGAGEKAAVAFLLLALLGGAVLLAAAVLRDYGRRKGSLILALGLGGALLLVGTLPGIIEAARRCLAADSVFSADFAKYSYLLIFTLLFAVLVALAFRRYGYPLGTFALLCLAAPLLTSPPSNPLMSMNRLVVVIFPAFMLLGAWGRSRDFERLYAFAGTMGLALFTTLFFYGMWAG